jgi:histidine triad (HIT) family protein
VTDCVFCGIVDGRIPSKELFRSDSVVVNPQAPFHALVVPVGHVRDLSSFADSASDAVIGELFRAAARIGREHASDGYRIVVNEGTHGGQTVFHLHIHVLSGRGMGWPPG